MRGMTPGTIISNLMLVMGAMTIETGRHLFVTRMTAGTKQLGMTVGRLLHFFSDLRMA